MAAEALSIFNTRTRSVALVICFVCTFLYFVGFVIPAWITYTSDTVTMSAGLFMTCIGSRFDVCSTMMKKDDFFKASQVFGTLGLVVCMMFAITAALTFFWTTHWKKLKVLKLAAGTMAITAGILISLTTFTIIRSDMSDDTKLSYSGYLGLVSCVLSVLLTPFYIIDGIKTRKQLETPPDNRQKRWDRTEPILPPVLPSLAPEPTFIKDRCPTYHSRIHDDDDNGSKKTRSPLIDKILNRKPKKEKKKKKTKKMKNSQETTDKLESVEKTDKETTEAMPVSTYLTFKNETKEMTERPIKHTERQDGKAACALLLDSTQTYDNIVQDEQEIALNMDTTTTDFKSPDTNVASNSASYNLHIDINNTSDINMQENEATEVALSIKSKKDERSGLSIKTKKKKKKRSKIRRENEPNTSEIIDDTGVKIMDTSGDPSEGIKTEESITVENKQIMDKPVHEHTKELEESPTIQEDIITIESKIKRKKNKKRTKGNKELPHFFKEYLLEEKEEEMAATGASELQFDHLIQETEINDVVDEDQEEGEKPQKTNSNTTQSRVVSAKFRKKVKK